MIYPKFIKKNSCIGVSAVSDGCNNKKELMKMNNAISNIQNKGFNIRITDNCKTSTLGRSSDAVTRARELENLFLDDDVDAIICLGGGDFLIEILPILRYDIIWNNPKWIQGYSDPTGLLFTITTNLGIATIYGSNFKTFSMNNWHKSLIDNFEILKGNIIVQNSFDLFQKNLYEKDLVNEVYQLDTLIKWHSLDNRNITFKGRLIGGCLDALLDLIGTRYDKTTSFLEKYRDDGYIWYFDIYNKSLEDIIRAMWHFKNAGWFKYIKGIMFGRLINESSNYNISLQEALITSLKDLNIPIIYDIDLGHTSPRMTLINGCIAEVRYFDHKGTIKMYLE